MVGIGDGTSSSIGAGGSAAAFAAAFGLALAVAAPGMRNIALWWIRAVAPIWFAHLTGVRGGAWAACGSLGWAVRFHHSDHVWVALSCHQSLLELHQLLLECHHLFFD